MPALHGFIQSPVMETPEDCGDLGISIDRGGCWHYHGSPIDRKEMVCLFASMLTRRPDGSYWLVTDDEMGRIQVEDVPFLAVEMFKGSCGRDMVVSFRTNVDELVTVDRDHPLRLGDGEGDDLVPYVLIRPGIGGPGIGGPGIEARLTRSVYYDLVAAGVTEKVDGEELYGIWSGGNFFALGRMPQDL